MASTSQLQRGKRKRKRKKDKYWEEYYQRKKELGKSPRFKSRCALCHKRFGVAGRFVFHHLFYTDADRGPTSFTDKDTKIANNYAYRHHILDQVELQPNKFRLLCSRHHSMVTIALRLKNGNWRRFYGLVNESRRGIE